MAAVQQQAKPRQQQQFLHELAPDLSVRCFEIAILAIAIAARD
jgi:hypothetical protein